mmetsp:Transcript_10007/g.22960  ORF Transcript_10007/g.22960 Transcript_10007/m.22960 type:complete len:771 (-) Transcript_10007:74-2386(-)
MYSTAFQGGPHFEVLTTQGRNPTEHWKLTGKINKEYDKSVLGFVFDCDGGTSVKMQVPKDPKQSLALVQRYLVLQGQVGKVFSMELNLSDSENGKRRIVLSTAVTKFTTVSPVHVRVPFGVARKGVWLNLCLDLVDLVQGCFPSASFFCIDSITIFPSIKLRRVFTLRKCPPDSSGDEERLGIRPESDDMDEIHKTLEYPDKVMYFTQVISMAKIKADCRGASLPTPGSSAQSRRTTPGGTPGGAASGGEGKAHIAFGSKYRGSGGDSTISPGATPGVGRSKREGKSYNRAATLDASGFSSNGASGGSSHTPSRPKTETAVRTAAEAGRARAAGRGSAGNGRVSGGSFTAGAVRSSDGTLPPLERSSSPRLPADDFALSSPPEGRAAVIVDETQSSRRDDGPRNSNRVTGSVSRSGGVKLTGCGFRGSTVRVSRQSVELRPTPARPPAGPRRSAADDKRISSLREAVSPRGGNESPGSPASVPDESGDPRESGYGRYSVAPPCVTTTYSGSEPEEVEEEEEGDYVSDNDSDGIASPSSPHFPSSAHLHSTGSYVGGPGAKRMVGGPGHSVGGLPLYDGGEEDNDDDVLIEGNSRDHEDDRGKSSFGNSKPARLQNIIVSPDGGGGAGPKTFDSDVTSGGPSPEISRFPIQSKLSGSSPSKTLFPNSLFSPHKPLTRLTTPPLLPLGHMAEYDYSPARSAVSGSRSRRAHQTATPRRRGEGGTPTHGGHGIDHEEASVCEDDEDEDLELMYDPILNCYYDPRTNKYYELKQ